MVWKVRYELIFLSLPKFQNSVMRVVNKIAEVKQFVSSQKKNGKTIGLVPTMGALHQGHISLVKEASNQCDVVIVSIFVNPSQFNNIEDLQRYPRNMEQDLTLLNKTGCELVFAPEVKEVYPVPDERKFDFGSLEKVMEGFYRPGHFNGVAQIVSKLFDYVKPDKAYFGLKDFQQLAIIKELKNQQNLKTEIVDCPIIREKDGLAMSSRNLLLTNEERKNAPVIAATLIESCNFVPEWSVKKVADHVVNHINSVKGFEVEYFEIVNGNTLQRVDKWSDSNYIVGCIAVYVGKVRLIDNIIYKNYRHEY